MDIIEHSYVHPTAKEIYQLCLLEIPNISLGTVYRNLSSMVDLGLIQRISMPDGVDRFDRVDEHMHFICVKCGKIIDIHDKIRVALPNVEDSIVIDYDVQFKGICKNCRED